MSRLKKFYYENIYGIIGSLAFHVLLLAAILLANVKIEGKVQEEEIIIDFDVLEQTPEEDPADNQQSDQTDQAVQENQQSRATATSNRAVNDAAKKDPFFDSDYQQEILDAQKLVSDVNKQLSQEVKEMKDFEMPAQTTEGMDPEKISNTIYSGESNIHYDLKDRYHLSLPIPVYLARGGGKITVKIWVAPDGHVTKATLLPYSNINDNLLPEYALQAALNTLFNASSDAPSPQTGTITYTFVAQ